MKRIILFCLTIFCAGYILAQDILALKNGEQIENVQVISITDTTITYSQNGQHNSVPRNAVSAILYADGRYEEIKASLVGSNESIAAAEQFGYDANELQTLINNGEDRKMLLWQDKTYPSECRKIGKKVYYQTFSPIYQEAYKEAKASGLKGADAMQKAIEKAFPPAVKASNEAVRECNGGM